MHGAIVLHGRRPTQVPTVLIQCVQKSSARGLSVSSLRIPDVRRGNGLCVCPSTSFKTLLSIFQTPGTFLTFKMYCQHKTMKKRGELAFVLPFGSVQRYSRTLNGRTVSKSPASRKGNHSITETPSSMTGLFPLGETGSVLKRPLLSSPQARAAL